MESRTRCLLLSLALLVAMPPAVADEQGFDPLDASAGPPLVEPELDRRKVKRAAIDTENIEVGVFGGMLSIEDFGSSAVVGAMIAWHFTEDLFLQLNLQTAEAGLSSYEVLSGGTPLLTADERELFAYDLSVGYNLFPGEAFIGRGRAYNTAFYLLAGIGSTDFAGEDRLTLSLGAGYRLLVSDWFA